MYLMKQIRQAFDILNTVLYCLFYKKEGVFNLSLRMLIAQMKRNALYDYNIKSINC